ncbi:uncharacterized protein BP01DRAFT_223882 [Aspergillus saccharolyticus JOP 1030-1]|uniref:Uncharacterized protein n=1 Tax=Aspergillus saccharolyticus JOP 1030-1 TaxID=1450539 RepID=A0A318Z6A1_9EURO|nr:hypothetical protein BP01DRAFT_223882 [Aspergillus saccharolyticus JOP 1030-1]PYH40313.1 hypothetical protein BP01DRAFT_223882 [Aspergillus saccharolyticus JOP 1030-1]
MHEFHTLLFENSCETRGHPNSGARWEGPASLQHLCPAHASTCPYMLCIIAGLLSLYGDDTFDYGTASTNSSFLFPVAKGVFM